MVCVFLTGHKKIAWCFLLRCCFFAFVVACLGVVSHVGIYENELLVEFLDVLFQLCEIFFTIFFPGIRLKVKRESRILNLSNPSLNFAAGDHYFLFSPTVSILLTCVIDWYTLLTASHFAFSPSRSILISSGDIMNLNEQKTKKSLCLYILSLSFPPPSPSQLSTSVSAAPQLQRDAGSRSSCTPFAGVLCCV